MAPTANCSTLPFPAGWTIRAHAIANSRDTRMSSAATAIDAGGILRIWSALAMSFVAGSGRQHCTSGSDMLIAVRFSLLFTLPICCVTLCAQTAPQAGINKDIVSRLPETMKRFVDDQTVAGM